jgi:signal peptide peptidase SppA
MAKSKGFNLEALSRIDSRDMLVLQDTAHKVMADLTRFYETDAVSQGAAMEATSRENLEMAYGFDRADEEDRKPFVYQDGVAVIPIHGTLLNRCNYAWGFVTGYQYIRRMLNAALDDDDVELIVFDVDSPGGEAAGCFELGREIMASRRVKPSLAVIDALAASGGMALAAPATKVYAIPSARVGSIGVYRMHISYEGALKSAGIKVTFAKAGDHKVDGHPYADLPDGVLKEWEEAAGKTWDDFITLVADARDMEEDDVRATQARVYRADEALAKGLIDAVKTTTEAVSAFLAEQDGDPSDDDEEEINMADAKGKEVTSALTDGDLQKIATIAAQAAGAVVSAAMGGMQRAAAIKDYAATKGKQFAALAATLVKNENLTEEDAIAIIDSAAGGTVAAPAPKAKTKGKQAKVADPEDEDDDDDDDADGDDADGDDADESDEDGEEAARASRRQGRDKVNHFDKAMGKSRQPKVGGGKAKSGDDDEGGRPKVNALLADHAKVTGASWSKDALKH